MSYFFQRAGIKESSSLSSYRPVSLLLRGGKRVQKSRRKKLFKSNCKGVPQGSPPVTHSWWHLRSLQGSVSYKEMMLQCKHCLRLQLEIQEEMRDWGQRAGRIQPKCNNNLSKHRSELKIKKAKGLHN